MKVIHPNVNSNLYLMEYILKFLYNAPIIKDYVRYYFPVETGDFIRDFMIQTDMVNEGNNIFILTIYTKIKIHLLYQKFINFQGLSL